MERFAAGLRRFALLLGGLAAVNAVASLVFGLALGASANRSISVGFYVVGSFMLIAGFFIGNRGPARFRDETHGGFFGPRRVRWATLEERTGSLNDSAVFITAGLVLLVVGALIDQRVKLI